MAKKTPPTYRWVSRPKIFPGQTTAPINPCDRQIQTTQVDSPLKKSWITIIKAAIKHFKEPQDTAGL